MNRPYFPFLLFLCLFLIPVRGKAGDTKQIKQQIEQGKQLLVHHKYVQAVELFRSALQDAEGTGMPELVFDAEYNLGVSYSFVSANGQAMEHYYHAYRIANEAKLDWQRKAYVENGIAGIYCAEKKYDKAREMLRSCLAEATANNDSTSVVAYLLNLAEVCTMVNDTSQAEKYLEKAQDYEAGSSTHYLQQVELAKLRMKQKRYDEVWELSDSLLKTGQLNQSNRSILMLYKIQILLERNQYQEARVLAEDARSICQAEQKVELYEYLVRISRHFNDLPKVIEYMDTMLCAKDDYAQLSNSKLMEDADLELQMFKAEQKVQHELAKYRYRRNFYLLLLCIFGLIIVFTVIIIIQQRVRNRQKQQLVENQMRETELYAKYQQNLAEMELERQRHKLSVTSMITTTRNELLLHLLEKLNEIQETQNSPQLQHLVIHLRQLMNQVENKDRFLIDFQSAHPGLLERISKLHPALSDSDLQFLAFVSMNLSNNDISSLINISPDSCKKRRMRLSKKLGLESSTLLYEYITNL